MEQVDISLVVGIVVTMVFSAFFSGMEIAFVSSNRMLAEMDKEKNGFTQRLLSLFYHHPNGFVSTMLVGNNIALVVRQYDFQWYGCRFHGACRYGFVYPYRSFYGRVLAEDFV